MRVSVQMSLGAAGRSVGLALADNPQCLPGLLSHQRVVVMERGPITGAQELLALLYSPMVPGDAYWWLHLSGDRPCLARLLYSTEAVDGFTPESVLTAFARRMPGARRSSIAVAHMHWFDAFEEAASAAQGWVSRFTRLDRPEHMAGILRERLRAGAGNVVHMADWVSGLREGR